MERNKKAGCMPTRQTPPYSAEYRGRVPLSPANKNIIHREKKSRLSNSASKPRTLFKRYETITFEKSQNLIGSKRLKFNFSNGGKMSKFKILSNVPERGGLVLKTVEIFSDNNQTVPTEFLLLRKGKTEFEGGYYILDDDAADKVIANFKKRGIDVVIDYEHQTIWGDKAPAAGWIKDLKKTQEGIVAVVEWTDTAKEFLKNREYRYFSPVIELDENYRVVSLHSVALTNAPKTYNQISLVAKNNFRKEEFDMNPEICKALGLSEDADEKAVLSAIVSLKEKAGKTKEIVPTEILKALGLKEDADKSEIVATIHALKQTTNAVKVEEIAALKRELAQLKAEKLVEEAMEEGKITPSQKEWALNYAISDEKGFKAFVEKAPVVAPLKNLPKGKQTDDTTISETLKRVAQNMGVSIEDIKKYGGLK